MLTLAQQKDWLELRAEAEESFSGANGKKPNREKWERQVALEVPLGEFIAGLAVKFYASMNGATVGPITGHERFAAHGLEGKASIRMQYGEALIQSQAIEDFRFRIVDEEPEGLPIGGTHA